MAIVFLDCQRGSLRLTQMMSLDVKMLEETFHSVESNLWAPQGALLGLVQKTSTPHYIARQLSTLRLHPRPTFGSTGDRQVPRSTYFWTFKSVGEPKEHEVHFLPWALLSSSESPLNISDTESVAKVVFLGVNSPRLDLLVKVDIPRNLNSEAVLQRNG